MIAIGSYSLIGGGGATGPPGLVGSYGPSMSVGVGVGTYYRPIIYSSILEEVKKTLTDAQQQSESYLMYKLVNIDINMKERTNELKQYFAEPLAVCLTYYEFYECYLTHK